MGFSVPSRSRGSTGLPGLPGAAGNPGRGVSHTDIVNGSLVVTYTDGTVANVGHVLGEPGAAGAAGVGIAAIEIVSGRLQVTLSNGTTRDLGQVVGATGATGAAGRGVTSSAITNGRLVLTYTDGTTQDLGAVTGATGATGAAGKGVTSTAISNGHLILTYTDGSTQDVGQVVGAAGASGAAAPLRRSFVHWQRFSSSGTWDREAGFAAAVQAAAALGVTLTADDLDVRFEAVGGGASGYNGINQNSGGGFGGNPGSVNFSDWFRRAELAVSIGYVVGAGGAAVLVGGAEVGSRSNPGSPSSVGSLVSAPGGAGDGYYGNGSYNLTRGMQASQVALGEPGGVKGQSGDGQAAGASNGPGGGGGGATWSGSGGATSGGAGGASTADRPDLTLAGGAGQGPNLLGQAPSGQAATKPFQYGSGGGGPGQGSSGGSTSANQGGAGGYPGGGGGGGGSRGGSTASSSGPGAGGCVTAYYFRRIL